MNRTHKRISITDWLHYEDLINFDPDSSQQVLVRGEGEWDKGDMDSNGWQRQTHIMRCVLIPLNLIELAVEKLGEWDIKLDSYWEDDYKFNFGDAGNIEGIPIEQFIYEREHPTTRDLIIELKQDFIRYHSLDLQNGNEYLHPLEDLVVVRVNFSEQEPRTLDSIVIHRDFLKDYLSARKSGLLLGLAMDRFFNTDDLKKAEIKEEKRNIIRPGLARQIDIHKRTKMSEMNLFRIRSTLWKTDVIKPYDKPKNERNFWHPPSFDNVPTEAKFYVDSEGNKLELTEKGVPPYLYFKRSVLERYVNAPGYRVVFHMRKWGRATNPRRQGIDVGLNSEGLITAFAPDIAKLPSSEQAYWSSYSAIPVGEVCEELFQTRMMLNPPDSLGVLDLIYNIKKKIDKKFESLTGEKIYKEKEPEKKELFSLTVGPLHDNYADLVFLAKILYQWTIESMQIKILKKAVKDALKDEPKAHQIRYLEEVLIQKANLTSEDAKDVVFPLRGLNSLRQMDAHLRSEREIKKALNQIGISEISSHKWRVWDSIVDNIVSCFKEIIALQF